MLYDVMYGLVCELVKVRNYAGALAVARAWDPPTSRDQGLCLMLQAELLRRAACDGLRVRELLQEAAPFLRPYPGDFAQLCAVGAATGAHEYDRRQLQQWMVRLAKLHRRHRLALWIVPTALVSVSYYLRGRCRWRAALAVLSRAHQLLLDIPGERQRLHTTALEAAWTAACAGDLAEAVHWRHLAGTNVEGHCWVDKALAVDLEIALLRGQPAAILVPVHGSDDGAMFLAIARIKLARAHGAWEQAARDAFHLASVSRQQWALGPIREVIRTFRRGEGAAHAAD